MKKFELCKIDEDSIINKLSSYQPKQFEKVDSLTSKQYEEKMKKMLEKKKKKTFSCDTEKEEFIVLH